jgi:inhibitor of cysteine peptidase
VTPQNEDGSGEDELKSLSLTDADNGKTVTVTQGQNVLVKLQSNPTTGYKWVVASTDRTFGYPAYDRFIKNGDAVGSGGIQRLTWKTKSPLNMVGSHKVKLEYRRPWEENVNAAKTFEFTVNIVDGACPEIEPPPPGFCSTGQLIAKKDANGCTTGFECKTDCRSNACGSGRYCTFCWGHYACIPNGAMC